MFGFLKSKLKLFRVLFITPAKRWSIPRKCEVLIYGAGSEEVLLPYLERYKVGTMDFPRSVNMLIFMRAIFTLNFIKGKPHIAYHDAFIRTVKPRLIITFIDNDINFYSVAKRFPSIVTIFIQNGVRGSWAMYLGATLRKNSHMWII